MRSVACVAQYVHVPAFYGSERGILRQLWNANKLFWSWKRDLNNVVCFDLTVDHSGGQVGKWEHIVWITSLIHGLWRTDPGCTTQNIHKETQSDREWGKRITSRWKRLQRGAKWPQGHKQMHRETKWCLATTRRRKEVWINCHSACLSVQ